MKLKFQVQLGMMDKNEAEMRAVMEALIFWRISRITTQGNFQLKVLLNVITWELGSKDELLN